MLQLLPARVGMNLSPDLTLTGLQVALTHWVIQEKMDKRFYVVLYKVCEQKLVYLYKNAIL